MARTNPYVLYIPGLGDDKINGQRIAIYLWRLWGIKGEIFHSHWSSNETWEMKLERLLNKVDSLIAKHDTLTIIGVSAGASAAITIYSLRKSQIIGCVLIAGKINHSDTIGKDYRQNNPAFVQSVQACEKALLSLNSSDRKRIMSRYALFDNLIPREDSYIAGAHNQTVHSVGHLVTIATQITIGAPIFLRFLKTLTKKTNLKYCTKNKASI